MVFSDPREAEQSLRKLLNGLWGVLEGSGLVFGDHRGAMQAFRKLLDGLWVVLGGPRVVSIATYSGTQWRHGANMIVKCLQLWPTVNIHISSQSIVIVMRLTKSRFLLHCTKCTFITFLELTDVRNE